MNKAAQTQMHGGTTPLKQGLALLNRLEALDQQRVTAAVADQTRLLEESIGLCNQAVRSFREAEETWLTWWVTMLKATVLAEMAALDQTEIRPVNLRSALELIQQVLLDVEATPIPNLLHTARLYSLGIDTLFRIRAQYEEPAQQQTLDNLIRGLAERLGEIQALEFATRAAAYEDLYAARVLDSLNDLVDEGADKQELNQSVAELAYLAYEKLRRSSSPHSESARQLFMTSARKLDKNAPPDNTELICAGCGQASSANTTFCSHCGVALQPAIVPPTEMPAANICRACNFENRIENNYCTFCGTALSRGA